MERFNKLSHQLQLSATVLAVDVTSGQFVSLLQYMENDDVFPVDLRAHADRFTLVVPDALFSGIAHVRRDKSRDSLLWASLARDVMSCVAAEVGNELSRMYEYQIALMFNDASLRLLAEHAAHCVIAWIDAHTQIERNLAIKSVVTLYPENPDGKRKLISAVVGNNELQWDLNEVFKVAGLRKELCTESPEDIISDSGIDSPDSGAQAWRFCCDESGASLPGLYGYRGQTIQWCYESGSYKLDAAEDAAFAQEVTYQETDYHRKYMPYRRLVSHDQMMAFCRISTKQAQKPTLADVMKAYDACTGAALREDIQPVYRPTNGAHQVCFDDVVLDNVDLTRANMASTDLRKTRAHNARLLLADLRDNRVPEAAITGADISYSRLRAEHLSYDTLRDVTARHVMLNEASATSYRGEPAVTCLISDSDGKIVPLAKGKPNR